MSLVEQALDALAQRGSWVCRDPLADLEQTRAELRRAARHRGIRLRTTINWAGYLIAHTPDGFPAEEPWRGAAIHIHDSDAWVDVIQLAWRRQAEEGSD